MSDQDAQAELDYLLYRIPLFAAFSKNVAHDLASRITERKVAAGQAIFSEGDLGKELLIVRRGSVKIFLAGGDGRQEAVLAVLGNGEFFGELSLLDGETRSASAVAEVETILLCLDHESFYAALGADFEAVRHVIAVLCHRLRETDVRLASAAFRDVRERLAHRLWQMAERESEETADGLKLTAEISDSDLAGQIGATTGRIHDELLRLQRDLVIKRFGSELTVLKPNDLRDMALGATSAAVITVPEWLLG
jgi:CRP-like cAMP-binding protein